MCYCCLEQFEETKLSKCINCKEEGFICHECILEWSENTDNISRCSICKYEESMLNLPNYTIEMDVSPETYLNGTQPIIRDWDRTMFVLKVSSKFIFYVGSLIVIIILFVYTAEHSKRK
tara:strand:- start:15444 stop:15800 length:357 start_codon:yes stop_codon:yes gene_type:complete